VKSSNNLHTNKSKLFIKHLVWKNHTRCKTRKTFPMLSCTMFLINKIYVLLK